MITRYGRDVVFIELAVAVVLSVFVWVFGSCLVQAIVWPIVALFTAFTVYFFRDPQRSVPPEALAGKAVVLSPGDGKVVQIIPATEPNFIRGPVTQVSVFLSPLNVHVNRIPISGTIGYLQYIHGEYIVAFHEKASEKNERTEIGIDTGTKKVLFKQIAGYVARRIVCPLKVGDVVRIGDRFGMIKFGSRVDILMPEGSAIRVKLGDVVVGGETIIGTL